MSGPVHDTKIGDEAVQTLASQFRGKPRIESLVRAFAAETQAVQDAFWALLTNSLATAVGAQQDQIGALLDMPRNALTGVALSDDEYQVVLFSTVRARLSSGTDEDLIAVMRLIYKYAFDYSYGYASVRIEPRGGPFACSGVLVAAILRIARAGGVELQVFDPPSDDAHMLTFSTSAYLSQTDNNRGLADWPGGVGPSTLGGKLTGVVVG